MTRRPRVFVTHENPKLNYNTAERFGDLVFVTAGDFSLTRNSPNNASLIKGIRSTLDSQFDPDTDFVVISGSPIVSAVAMMVLGEIFGRVNILRWSNHNEDYQPLEINIGSTS